MNILITGGSRGIGAAAVRLFAARGDRVWFLYEKSYEKARALSFDTGAVGICCDVADEAAVQAAFRELPPLDGLICNAGIAHYGLISEITPDAWRRIFAVNVDGIFHCVRAALPGMLQKKDGCIVTVSSMWGQVGASCEAGYSATKGAVIQLTRSLAAEYSADNVIINCVCPGATATNMCKDGETPDEMREFLKRFPLGRFATPAEIASIIMFVSSDEASNMAGSIIMDDGGFSAI